MSAEIGSKSEAKMSFKEYVLALPITDDPEGDFVDDVRRDKTFPVIRTWSGLKRYLERHGACDEAIDAAGGIWEGYLAEVKL